MKLKIEIMFSVLIFLLVLAATSSGIFWKTPGAPIIHTTMRGEQVTYQGSGLYRYDPAPYALEGIIWDVVNLAVGLPLLGVAIFLSQRNSLRGRLLLGGLLFYFGYAYLMYMTGVAFNRLFLVYIAIFGLCGVTFFLNLSQIDVAHLPEQISPRFPRRLFIGFAFLFSAVLTFLWMGRILPIMISERFPPEAAGATTLVSQALDLGMVVPLLLSAGILLWRRSPWGALLTAISLTHGLMMFISIPAWIVIPLIQEGKINLLEAVPILPLIGVGLALAGLFFRNVQGTGQQTSPAVGM